MVAKMADPLGPFLRLAFMENLILPSLRVKWLFQELEAMLFQI